ncbi:MAG: rod shape-determining protein MreD [Nocardioides sp.]|nr:rod shape-determining protein MreD [Nocardioides sp.]
MSDIRAVVSLESPWVRNILVAVLVIVAAVLQLSVAPLFSIERVVPDLVLLVVVATGLARGGQAGVITGFAGGVLLDFAPPADHTAGRWALALLVVGYIAARVRNGGDRPTAITVMATVAACSFVGVSIFALTGMMLGESGGGELLTVAISLGFDIILAPLLMPGMLWLLRQGTEREAL